MSKDRFITAEELKNHRVNGDLWVALHGNVYNVSDFMEDHPGGADALLEQAGVDATAAFEDVGHSSNARAILEDLKIGKADNLEADTRTSSGEFMVLEGSSSSYTTKIALLLVSLLIAIWLATRPR